MELRWISREKASHDFMHNSAERVVTMRIPNVEQIVAARGKDAINLAIGFIFVGKEHHAELAHNRVEAAIREGQYRGIGRLEFDLLAGSELCTRDFEHRRIEIGRRQAYASRQLIAQPASDDPGAGRCLQYPRRTASGHTMRNVRGIVDENQRPQTSIIVLRYAAIPNEPRCIAIHDDLPSSSLSIPQGSNSTEAVPRARAATYCSQVPLLRCMSLVLMLWTAPPPALRCHGRRG
jgi:hypothetical protein